MLALIGVGAVALLGGIGVAWLLAGFLTRPPVALAETARRVAAGDLEARAPETGPREQREVAAAFNEMTARLASTLAAQRDFVANASHQLRTPLTGLRLRLEAASAEADDPRAARGAPRRRARGRAPRRPPRRTCSRSHAATSSRAAPVRSISTSRSRSAAERWESRADERGQRIELAGDGRVDVLASRADVEIVLDNLLENAIGYSPRGARIELDWGRAAAGPGQGFLAVLDEGPGLVAGEEERVLERFYRGGASAGGRKPGTGLGLAIVRVLAERWRGTVRLRNRDHGGLRAEVRLPLAPTPAGRERPTETLPVADRDFDLS